MALALLRHILSYSFAIERIMLYCSSHVQDGGLDSFAPCAKFHVLILTDAKSKIGTSSITRTSKATKIDLYDVFLYFLRVIYKSYTSHFFCSPSFGGSGFGVGNWNSSGFLSFPGPTCSQATRKVSGEHQKQ